MGDTLDQHEYCQHSRNGGTHTCLPAAHGVAPSTARYGPASASTTQDPREADDTKTSLGAASLGWLLRSGDIYAGVPREVLMTQAMTTKARRAPGGRQAGAGLRRVLVSSLVQRGQAQARASSKGNHFGATRPRPVGRQDGGHRGAQVSIIMRVFGRRGPTLVRISVLDVPLQNGQLLAPFPLNIWEEAQGLRL